MEIYRCSTCNHDLSDEDMQEQLCPYCTEKLYISKEEVKKVIIAIEMPENCDVCPLQTREDVGFGWECAITKSRINSYSSCRRNCDCPLKEEVK